MADRTLSHFALFTYTDAYWAATPAEQSRMQAGWLAALHSAAPQVEPYQIYPSRSEADVLIWSALPSSTPDAAATFFRCYAQAVNSFRHVVRPGHTFWGFTRPSVYARGQSAQELDPFSGPRETYLVIYPFQKTKEWYLMSRDARQGMMNEHIRIGHQYPAIKQLLLYSFGLQDQEFVVVYGVDDLGQFSDLVNELRSSEARRYTERDTPVYTAVHGLVDKGSAA